VEDPDPYCQHNAPRDVRVDRPTSHGEAHLFRPVLRLEVYTLRPTAARELV
jgi:hypothetical protein